MIIIPYSDRTCPCGRSGCVESELTPSATMSKLSEVFSAEKTPFLYEAARGSFENVNQDMITMAYEKDDKAVKEILNGELTLLAVLLNNLYFSTNPQKIVLHQFKFQNEKAFQKLKDAVTEIGGALVSSKIELSIIEDKHRFLSGCALAIRELFFNRGGFDTSSNN